jgi:biopolymer transport protein ExbB
MSLDQFSILQLFQRGGPVMWVLLLVSAVGLVIFVERALFLHRGHIRSTEFLEGIKNIVQKRRLVEALTVAEETPGPVANLVKAGLLHHEETEGRIRFAIQEAALVEIPALERRIGSIGAIAHIAPLLGLLGTVLGMIETFYQFEQAGVYATSATLSGGLWQAMLTTAAGLAVSIAAHLGHHFLAGRVRALVYDMEWVGSDLVEFLVHDREIADSTEDADL